MPDFALTFGDEMIARAARVLDRAYDRHEETLEQIAREVIEAAFDGVPLSNYSIGLLLQWFDLVVCVKGRAAGVYRSDGTGDGFDALAHTLTTYGPTRALTALTIGKIGQEPDDA